MNIKIGTRKSPLALAQAEEVSNRLRALWPELAVELVKITTSGDRFSDKPLADIGGKGLFTKEIEEALLDGSIDLAVHSMKDMPTVLPDGLTIGCMLEREDARDMLIADNVRSFADLPEGARVGTSSLRRAVQLQMWRPDIKIVPFRGNVQTRIEKLQQGKADATVLAMAGLNRLGILDAPGFVLETHECLPAVAQGAIGIECRDGNDEILRMLEPMNDAATTLAVTCERAFLKELDGSCRTPIAGYAVLNGAELHLRGFMAAIDGSAHHRIEARGSVRDAQRLGESAGKEIRSKFIS
jgi:hydroxymethylbilane synthase